MYVCSRNAISNYNNSTNTLFINLLFFDSNLDNPLFTLSVFAFRISAKFTVARINNSRAESQCTSALEMLFQITIILLIRS